MTELMNPARSRQLQQNQAQIKQMIESRNEETS